jgi:hypothetical protein
MKGQQPLKDANNGNNATQDYCQNRQTSLAVPHDTNYGRAVTRLVEDWEYHHGRRHGKSRVEGLERVLVLVG